MNDRSCCPSARYFAVNPKAFLLLNVALAFYNVGTIWAHEIDIFRSWKFVDATRFQKMHYLHWRKLPYWIFIPVVMALAGGIVLVWYHPANSPVAAPLGAVFCQALSLILTAIYWGRWQSKLAQDPRGPESPILAKILKTHWVRTLFINAYAMILLFWAIAAVS